MIRKRFFLRNVAAIAACLAVLTLFSGCGKDKADDPKPITVANNGQLTQTVFADKTEGASGVNITTTGAWTSSIAETAATRASSAPAWISISPESGDKAGQYNIVITLTPNTTGADRTAVITISCSGTEITITVTQKKEKEDGTVPTDEPFNRTVTGTIDNASDYGDSRINSISQIRAYSYKSDVLHATGVVQNGNFSFTLPETVENWVLTRFNLPSSVTLSDANVIQTHVNVESGLKLYDNHGVKVGVVMCESDKAVINSYMYTDRDCRITGSREITDKDIDVIFYNLNLKTGWNIVYSVDKGYRSVELVTTRPDEAMKWLVILEPERLYGGTGTFTNTRAADQPLTVDGARYRYYTNHLTFDKDGESVGLALYFNIDFPGKADGVPLPAGTYHFHDNDGTPTPEYSFYCQKGELGGVYYGRGGTLTVSKSGAIYTITLDMDTYHSGIAGKIQGSYTGYILMEEEDY